MDEIETVKAETLPIPVQAQAIIVKDQESLGKANEIFLIIKGLRKKISDTMDPVIAAAHNSHKVALAKKAELETPLIEAEKYLNGQVSVYVVEQERKRREEEERLRQEAIKAEAERRKKEEEERLIQAAELEAAGAIEEAEALIVEAIEEKEKPIEIYVPPPEIPKVKLAGATVKEYWSAQVFDLKALCKAIGDGIQPVAYIEANMTALNAQARSLKREMRIPGVKAISTSSLGATGKSKAA